MGSGARRRRHPPDAAPPGRDERSLGEQVARIVAELVAAGVEGGSKRRIEEEWTLIDYGEQRDYWEDCPPANITLGMIASALGIKIDGRAEPEYGSLVPDDGMSIAEIAAKIKPPKAGGSTLEASQEAWRLLNAPQGSA